MQTLTYPHRSHQQSNHCQCGGTCDECSTECDTMPDGIRFPNFFAGQLLIESDFRCLIDYVRSKTRLHNRHYLGAGVVCGLQVRHDVCFNTQHIVVVAPGHAIDGCGEDILLPREVKVDIAEQLRELRKRARSGTDCGDPCLPKPTTNQNGTQAEGTPKTYEYGLYIVFKECRTNMVTPYEIGASCGVGCEPSRIVESFEIELDCMPPPQFGSDASNALMKCLSCLGDYEENLKKANELMSRPQPLLDAAAKIVENIRSCLSIIVAKDHELLKRLSDMNVSSDNVKDNTPKVQEIINIVSRKCACELILPPCPVSSSGKVLIASLTVDQYCSVTKICNYVRTIIPTIPTLRYWFGDVLEDSLARICCAFDAKVKTEEIQHEGPESEGTLNQPTDTQSVTMTPDSISTIVQAIVRFAQMDVKSTYSPLSATFDSVVQRWLGAKRQSVNEGPTLERSLPETSTEAPQIASSDPASTNLAVTTKKAAVKKFSSVQIKSKKTTKKKAAKKKTAKKKTAKKKTAKKSS